MNRLPIPILLVWMALAVAVLAALSWPGSTLAGRGEAVDPAGETAGAAQRQTGRSISDTGIQWPTAEQMWRTFSLADHNTRIVFAGVTVLGAAGGVIGTFLLLRKRSLLSDTVSHCTLPGVALAFLLAEGLGGSGRSLPLLLTGAAVTGVLGMVLVAAIRASGRIKDDAALAIVLSVFFGLGVALLVVVQQLPTGNAAGLARFIYGKAASLTRADALLILIASGVVTLVVMILFKEFKLLCFDAEFARTQGWPVVGLDLMLMGLVVAVTVIGLQAVGLLLVVALLIVPPAAARFWTHRLDVTVLLAGFVGAASGFVGAALSALVPKLPAGAVIVLAAVGCFGLSFAFGFRRGVVVRWFQDRAVARRVARQHLLRGLYEWCEGRTVETRRDPVTMLEQLVPLRELAQASHWSDAVLRRLVRRGQNEGLISIDASGRYVHLSPQGKLEARTVTRNHRLWETYLLHYADVAPQHIHHNADRIEHVVEPDVVNELEELMAGRAAEGLVPADPERSSTMPREASAP